MLNSIILLIFFAGSAAISALLFNNVLNQAGEILAFKPKLVYYIASLGKQSPLTSWKDKNLFQHAFIKVLNDCPKCAAGWIYLVLVLQESFDIKLVYCGMILSIYIAHKLTPEYGS